MVDARRTWLALAGMVCVTQGCPQPSSETPARDVPPASRTQLADPPGVEPGDVAALALAGMKVAPYDRFNTSTACAMCHSNHTAATAMRDEANRAIAPFNLWQSSMMANASRDPLWRAVVAAEGSRYPDVSGAIEGVCMRCHAPLASEAARAQGYDPSLYDLVTETNGLNDLARDGVSCSLCHQIQPGNLGTPESFSGGFTVGNSRLEYGPHQGPVVGPMQVHVNFTPAYSSHVTESSLCATCHNLTTHTLAPDGSEVEGALFQEQATYSEWLNSSFNADATAGGKTCQACHMPTHSEDGQPISTRIARSPPGGDFNITVRTPFGRHAFAGANVLMPGILKNERATLNPQAPDGAFDATVAAARDRLERETATLLVDGVENTGGALSFNVAVDSLVGHKFPTGFPSRRAWLRVRVLDARGNALFASGSFNAQGRLVDRDSKVLDVEKALGPWEPHHDQVTRSDEVQIYEQVMGGTDGQRTASILAAAAHLKDNRLLPRGYSVDHESHALTAPAGVSDANFQAGSDRVTYRVSLGSGTAARVEVALFYQTVGARFVADLFQVDTPEVRAFRTMYERADLTPVQVAHLEMDL